MATGYSMSAFNQTHHFVEREQQRGVRHEDLDLVLAYGEMVEEGFVMSDKARRRAIDELRKSGDRRAIQKLDHLRNVAVIEQDGQLITVYRTDARHLRVMRRKNTYHKRLDIE